ncbi:hypothetical protein ACROYT_G006115 [Oculina patagonica]
MADRAPDIFDTEPEGGSDEENVEEEDPQEEEEEYRRRIVAASKKMEKWTMIHGIRYVENKRRLRRIYLERLKWSTHRIKRDALHRKVMKTLRRFISEDDMVFDEAAESAVEKRKFLLNRVMRKKLVPNESDDDEEEEVEASEQQYYY